MVPGYWQDSFRFLPWFPSDESPGYGVSPAGLGWYSKENMDHIWIFA
jgi:hypothetical protein